MPLEWPTLPIDALFGSPAEECRLGRVWNTEIERDLTARAGEAICGAAAQDHGGTQWTDRRADGRLGVQAQSGGRPVSIVMNVTTPDVQGFARSQSQIAAQMARALGRGDRNR